MTDVEFMLAVLRERPDQWVAQSDIIERSQQERGHGITVHSRASDLRKLGYDVENQVVRGWDGYHRKHVGRATSYYRLRTLTAAGSSLISPSENPPDSAAVSVSAASAASPGTAAGGASPQPQSGAALTLFILPKAPPWR